MINFQVSVEDERKYWKTRIEEKRKRLLFSAVNIKNKKIFVEDIYPESPNTTPIINRRLREVHDRRIFVFFILSNN